MSAPPSPWIAQIKEIPILEIASALGMKKVGSRGFGPCPMCGELKRSEGDKRGAVLIDATGWTCVACKNKGDGLNLVSSFFFKTKLRSCKSQQVQHIREFLAKHGFCNLDDADPQPKHTPLVAEEPRIVLKEPELRSFWDHCGPVQADRQVSTFVRSRGWDPGAIDKLGIFRVTPPATSGFKWPEWWPQGRAHTWRLVTPAFNASGALCSFHGRAVLPVEKPYPKCLWPKNVSSSGLMMADKLGIQIMRGDPTAQVLIIVEGMTDLIASSLSRGADAKRVGIIACTSGSFRALRGLTIPRWMQVYAATDEGDADGTGDRYAAEIAQALSPRKVKRLPISKFLGR